MSWTITPTQLLVDDPDAVAYIAAVEAADTAAGQTGGLETATKMAINAFVKGCKADGIWPAIKASCILAGARTLAGALVPLVGTAPTNNNFVSGDYDRKTGLVGNGSPKYLNSNYAMPNTLANNNHLAWWTGSAPSADGEIAGGVAASNSNGYIGCYREAGGAYYANWNSNNYAGPTLASSSLAGVSRSSSTSFIARSNNTSSTIAQSVVASPASSLTSYIFCRNVNGSPNYYTNARLAFYSIGESLDLAKLDSRVTDLINAIGAAF